MKSGLTVVLFRLFTIGVFVGGKESNGESVSVTEGDSVTLMSGVTEIQTDDKIKWEFKGSNLATISIDSGEISEWIKHDGPFRNRLQLDKQTGDLKISNIKTTDSGLYIPKISSPRGSPPEMTFTVKVVSTGAAKTVILNVGDSVTLRTDVTDIQRVDVIRWRFGLQKSSVAEINRTAGIFIRYDGPDEGFRDRLTLDNQTGSLIITNTRTTDSGLYEAEMSSGKHTIHKSFSVTVRDEVKSVSVLMGDSVTLLTGITGIQRDYKILWKFKDQDIAGLKTWSNIVMNNQTGDLNISNIQRNQSGHYKVEIITRRMILHRKYRITIGDVTGEMKSVSVKEGGSVTLQINVTEIQSDDLILWMFGNINLAEFNKTEPRFHIYDGPDERFRGRLKLDHQTGSLKITDTRTSGDYELKISSSRHIINRRINVTVSGSGLQSDAGMSSGTVAWIVAVVVAVVVAVGATVGVMCYCRKISELERQREGFNLNKKKTYYPVKEVTKLDNDP